MEIFEIGMYEYKSNISEAKLNFNILNCMREIFFNWTKLTTNLKVE